MSERYVDELSVLDDPPDRIDLDGLCANSVFYPACRFDGSPVKMLSSRFVRSFIYVDYGVTSRQLQQATDERPFRGYSIRWQRPVQLDEYFPAAWLTSNPPTLPVTPIDHLDGNLERSITVDEEHAHWFLLERQPDFADDHGPASFSLLFICGYASIVYQALFWNRTRPKCVVIISPGTGFGGNWTDFRDPKQFFCRSVMQNPAGTPDWLLYGGYSDAEELKGAYDQSCWPDYYDNDLGLFHHRQYGRYARLWGRSTTNS